MTTLHNKSKLYEDKAYVVADQTLAYKNIKEFLSEINNIATNANNSCFTAQTIDM